MMVIGLSSPALASHQWLNYHWKRHDAQVTIKLVDSSSDFYRTNINGTPTSDWDGSSRHIVVRETSGVANDASTRLNCPAPKKYRRVRLCTHDDYNFANPNKLGEAQVWTFPGTGHLAYATAKVEADRVSSDAERRSAMCQEIGHTLGLDHRDPLASDSCMVQTNGPEHPDSHDYDQLANITHKHEQGEVTTDPPGLQDSVDYNGDPCINSVGLDICLTNISLGHTHGGHTHGLDRYTISFFRRAPIMFLRPGIQT